MITPVTASKIFSVLGNNDSLVPMAIKDISNSVGLTAGSYITGQAAEGQDRFIDEFGTQAIWLFGIPAYKKLLDLTMFKSSGFDSGVDVRILKDKEVFELAKQYAKKHDELFKNNIKVPKIAKSLEHVSAKQKAFKGLTFGKFAISTLMTIFTYSGLTKFRQKYREEKIKKEFLEKHSAQKTFTSNLHKPNMTDFMGKKTNPAFTGSLQDFMFSPVKNLMIVDASISGERLLKSKNKQELTMYAIKEGSFWFFMYFAGAQIKKLLEKHSLKKHNIPIDIDPRAIESEELKNALLNNKVLQSINEFPAEKNLSNADIYRFVNENQENLIVKMAKKSDIVKTVKVRNGLFKKSVDTGSIDNRKFIDPNDIISLKDKLKVLYDKGQEFIQSKAKNMGKKVEELSADDIQKLLGNYLETVKKGTRKATLKNIGACIGFLGVIMPATLIAWRFFGKGNKEYQVRTDVENKLKSQMNLI